VTLKESQYERYRALRLAVLKLSLATACGTDYAGHGFRSPAAGVNSRS
jgi:hypothetical protein